MQQNRSLKYLFGIARQSKKNSKDIVGIPCIHGKDENIKVSLKDKMEVWKEYEQKLLNENQWVAKQAKWQNDVILWQTICTPNSKTMLYYTFCKMDLKTCNYNHKLSFKILSERHQAKLSKLVGQLKNDSHASYWYILLKINYLYIYYCITAHLVYLNKIDQIFYAQLTLRLMLMPSKSFSLMLTP